MFSSSLKGPTSHDQMNMNQNKFRYCTSLAYHPKIHENAGNNIYLNQNVLGVDLQLCLCFTECNQCCPSPVGPTVGRLWASKTNRMQSTTWVQHQINSNSLISEPPNVCGCVRCNILVTPDRISLQGFLKSWQIWYWFIYLATCVICAKVAYSHNSMKPSLLRRHLEMKHSHLKKINHGSFLN